MGLIGETSTAFAALVRLSSESNGKLADIAKQIVADHDQTRPATPLSERGRTKHPPPGD